MVTANDGHVYRMLQKVGLVEVGLKPSKSGSRYNLLQHYVTQFFFEGRVAHRSKIMMMLQKERWILGRQNQQIYI